MLLCEAAGYEIILVETVGVGQSEYEVADLVDVFLLLLLPSTGDELQGIKKGIVEIANAIVINKADGALEKTAKITKGEYSNALSILGTNNDKSIFTCSALKNKNIDKIWEWVESYIENVKGSGDFNEKRAKQNLSWSKKLMFELIKEKIEAKSEYKELEQQIKKGKVSPLKAAQETLNLILKS